MIDILEIESTVLQEAITNHDQILIPSICNVKQEF